MLAPWVGKLTDSVHPRLITGFGFASAFVSLVWLVQVMTPDSATWEILLPMALLGIGNAFIWAPTSATATRNLPMRQAGAGSGIYNTTRTVGSVIGSAAIAAFMQNRLEAQLPGASQATGGFSGGTLPPFVLEGFSQAMAQAILLPAGVLLIGLVAVCFLRRPKLTSSTADWVAAQEEPAGSAGEPQPAAG